MTRRKTLLASLAALGAATLLLGACSSPSGAGNEDPDKGETVSLKVGYIPAGVYAYLWRAADEGYFAEEKLEVELLPMAGGGEVIPALQSGSIQFGISDALGVLNARNSGISAKYVSLNYAEVKDNTVHAVMTNDPSVKTAKDLVGKTVATNLSYNTDWIMMRQWLRANDVDPESVSFVEIPFPDMLGALRSKTVAAAGVLEPFVSMAKAEDFRVIGHNFADVKSPIVYTGIVSLDSYISEHSGVTERFVRAIDRAMDDFNEDPQMARDTIKAHTEIDPALVDSMQLGVWNTESSPDDMAYWIETAREEGINIKEVDPNELVWQGPQ